ncbi:beta-lactamase family protein [Actinomadura sp. ATCC 31491]|uniref:Beta-lactamase family protein n=1 Tax=Actinomadura luzonensis TaxID=2805427 RepID=A0ABT0FSV6_9ACTN|nr:serine hydrolase domain-containing protein [Actinomadura luzonensis]MCK2215424.1 beta-lactamase family protein [Actinomadura luzonensis]
MIESGALAAEAGYGPGEPIVAGVRRGEAEPVLLAQGVAPDGRPLTATTLVYAASLAKQMTAACAALLVRGGTLDPEEPLADRLPELPAWAATVRLRHLVHHTSGLPAGTAPGDLLPADATADRTTSAVMDALARLPELRRPPGTAFVYSNAGYVCLAAVMERAAGLPLSELAQRDLFGPLGMADTRHWSGPGPAPPGAAPLAPPHPAPLSLGDGGVWTTLRDLLRWGQALNADALGVAELLQTPGRLDDGTPLDYAWGMGVRSWAGRRVYRHGGSWAGLRALHARVPELDLTAVVVALGDDTERRVPLMDALLTAAAERPGEGGHERRR